VGGVNPARAKSLAIVLIDPDAPGGNFTHWIAWNILPVGSIPENIPKKPVIDVPIHAVQGRNSFGGIRYGGSCPPRGRTHRYFKVYALDTVLDLRAGAMKEQLERAMRGHVLQYGETAEVAVRRSARFRCDDGAFSLRTDSGGHGDDRCKIHRHRDNDQRDRAPDRKRQRPDKDSTLHTLSMTLRVRSVPRSP
jgi:Raf kinase inhibitor-like YbhB/YbcL family protein